MKDMKKIFGLCLLGIASAAAFAQTDIQTPTEENDCCQTTVSVCDSINIPVFIIDGVEVESQYLDSIASDDIIRVEVVKDPAVTRIFSPRLGGVLLITTKSKKFLKPLLQKYEDAKKAQPVSTGEIRIR